MSSQNEVSISNLSLLSIGARAQVSSINPSDGSVAADACSTLYPFVYEQLARMAQWGCLKKQASLTLIQASQGTQENPNGTSLPIPAQPWLYAYLYPADCLYVWGLVAYLSPTQSAINFLSISNNVVSGYVDNEQIDYEIAYSTDADGNPIQVILTNQSQALANYTVNQPNPQSWDSMFTAAYVALLAVYLVPALSMNTPLMSANKVIAQGLIEKAQAMDGNESPVSQDHVPDFIRARQGATGFLGPKYNAYGPIQMIWPI